MRIETLVENAEYRTDSSEYHRAKVTLTLQVLLGMSDLKQLLDKIKDGHPVVITDGTEPSNYVEEGGLKKPEPKDFLTDLRDQVSRFNLT